MLKQPQIFMRRAEGEEAFKGPLLGEFFFWDFSILTQLRLPF
jgi:hypothetical protein